MKKLLAFLLLPQLAAASPARVHADRRIAGAQPTGTVCGGGEVRCHAHVVTTPDGVVRANAAPTGYGAPDLEAAYHIDPSAQQVATIAIVDAFGYPTLEADLAKYRAQYGLPACTVASGCLTIVNQTGQTSPLPPLPTPDYDWTMETALDVDMASAACPSCKIVVVQTTDSSTANLFNGLFEAVNLQPTVVSNSWGMVESTINLSVAEADLAMASGIGIFASTGDSGYDTGGMGPQYPSTSGHVVAVGGTVLSTASNARGFSEVAWPMAGSSCSSGVAKLATQATGACAFRAASDVSAVAGDPGVAVYDTREGGWIALEGTSVSTPFVAAMFAAAGLGASTPDSVSALASTFTDVTTGTNGTCGTALCKAGKGWDGPTGYGTPNADQLGGGSTGGESLTVTSPQDGDTVAPGFAVTMDVTGALDVTVSIDGVVVGSASSAPYTVSTPASLAPGAHEVEVLAQDAAGNSGATTLNVDVEGTPTTGPTSNPESGELVGSCASGGGGGGALLALALVGLVWRRRR